MIEVPKSSCDKNRYSEGYAKLSKLSVRSEESNLTLEEGPERSCAPETVTLTAQHNLFKLHKDAIGGVMDLMRDYGDSSRECLYTPEEGASALTLSLTSPELKYRGYEEELEQLKAKRTKKQMGLREQVLEVDIPGNSESTSSSLIVSKNPSIVSEYDDRYSVSSRSSEENLTFLDASDKLNDDEESFKEHFDDEKASSSESVDFSFVHSVYRDSEKQQEALLLWVSRCLRMEAPADIGKPDTLSSTSIFGTASPSGTDAEMVHPRWIDKGVILDTLRKCTTGVAEHRIHERLLTPEMESASGCITPQASFPKSNKSSKTNVGSAESPSLFISLPPTHMVSHSASEHSSPSASRSATPPTKAQESLSSQTSLPEASSSRVLNEFLEPSPIISHQSDFNEYPTPDSPQRSTYKYTTPESLRRNTNDEYPTSKPIQWKDNWTSDIGQSSSESHGHHIINEHPISNCDTEGDWPLRSDRTHKRSRKKPLEIPITIDGRVVYPEVVFAEGNRKARNNGPLGLLNRVKSFAQNCGPNPTKDSPPEPSPGLQAFSEGCPEGEKASAKLNAALLSRLTCVECGTYCTPPVAMCVWGHVVCEECRPVGMWESHGRCWCRKRCPQCSGDMLSQPCDLWSNIARSLLYPCRFTPHGCRETQGLSHTDKLIHEQACLWRQLRCWCPGCSWCGVWHQLRTHVIRIHLPNATKADWYRFVAVCGASSIGRSSDVITLPAKELVLLHSLAIIGEHRYLLQYLNADGGGGGAVAIVPRFRLRVVSKDGKSEVEVRGEAVPGRHDVERALRSGKCFRLSGTPFGRVPPDETASTAEVNVQVCLEKGRLSVS